MIYFIKQKFNGRRVLLAIKFLLDTLYFLKIFIIPLRGKTFSKKVFKSFIFLL